MRSQTTRRGFTAALLLTGLVLLLTSTPVAAQTSQSQAPKRLDPGGTCEFGQPDYGAFCEHDNGVYGTSGRLGGLFAGASGSDSIGNRGYLGFSNYGVYGASTTAHYGYLGGIEYGAYGEHFNGHYGILGSTSTGAQGHHTNGNFGILGSTNYGVRGYATHGWAGYFQGDVHIIGTLTGGAAAFKVDHPLDPENQYLSHSVVESPDMMNVYNGNAVLNANGEALVELPAYFEALNQDFRYQLTCIGGFAPVYIAEKISNNRFKIAGGEPGMEVSWLVTGVRQDPWAEAHRLVVEEAKPVDERGYYLHPQLYGQPEERSVEWGRDPEGMRAMQAMPARRAAERRQIEQEWRQMQDERERLQSPHLPRPDNQP